MAYVEVHVDVEDYLDEVSTQALIDELEGRDDKPSPITNADDLETAHWHARNGRHSEALIYLEHALPQFKGLLWRT
jgi:hypothetical protein